MGAGVNLWAYSVLTLFSEAASKDLISANCAEGFVIDILPIQKQLEIHIL